MLHLPRRLVGGYTLIESQEGCAVRIPDIGAPRDKAETDALPYTLLLLVAEMYCF